VCKFDSKDWASNRFLRGSRRLATTADDDDDDDDDDDEDYKSPIVTLPFRSGIIHEMLFGEEMELLKIIEHAKSKQQLLKGIRSMHTRQCQDAAKKGVVTQKRGLDFWKKWGMEKEFKKNPSLFDKGVCLNVKPKA